MQVPKNSRLDNNSECIFLLFIFIVFLLDKFMVSVLSSCVLVVLPVLHDHGDLVLVHQEQQIFDRVAFDQDVSSHGQLLALTAKQINVLKERLLNDGSIPCKNWICEGQQHGHEDA